MFRGRRGALYPAISDGMGRLLDRASPWERMRIYTDGESPHGAQLPAGAVCLEWAGRTGHPSSYGLLGGWRDGTGAMLAPTDGEPFKSALAGNNDNVFFGLPAQYRDAVEQVQRTQSDIVFAVAAHGLVGSSEWVFRRLARALAAGLSDARLLSDDAAFWQEWDRLRDG